MKKLRIWLILAALLLLSACGEDGNITNTGDSGPGNPGFSENESLSDGDPASQSSGSPVQDDAQPPREGMVRSRLTNEWIDEDAAATRPIAVMIPNEHNAQPQYTLSEASILYEATVEGRMTRLLAIYENWQDLEKIGNIRSLRRYYAYWAFEWDAVIIHCGSPWFINDLLAEPETQTLNESIYADSSAFFRDETRRSPHNAYATGQGILSVIGKKRYPLEYRGLTDENHFQFTDASEPNTLEQYGENAMKAYYIDMSGCYPVTRCYFEYSEADGLYYRSQHLSGGTDGPHIDGATGRQLCFKNILVQYIKSEDLGLGGGYLDLQCSDTEEDGWYFTNGKGIHVTWEKSADYSPTKFYDDNGKEIVLNTGKTMICVVNKGLRFTFE